MCFIVQHSTDGAVEGFIVVNAIGKLLEGVQRLWWNPHYLLDSIGFLQEWVQDVINAILITERNGVGNKVVRIR